MSTGADVTEGQKAKPAAPGSSDPGSSDSSLGLIKVTDLGDAPMNYREASGSCIHLLADCQSILVAVLGKTQVREI